jgi:hypothetical protein
MILHGMSIRQSGRWGGIVYVDSKHGQLARALSQQARFVTPARLRARRHCADIAALWCTLSDDQKRVFIRVRQFSDGWQDLPREFQARMPRA